MERGEFRQILDQYFIPMFPGTRLGGVGESRGHHELVSYADPCSLWIKPRKGSDFRFKVRRGQRFERSEKKLFDLFADEFSRSVPDNADDPYLHDILAAIPRRMISRWLLESSGGRRTLQQGLTSFEAIAAQTYEGKPIVLSLGITGSQNQGAVTLEELFREDFSRVISNGFDSIYLSGRDGRVFNVSYLPCEKTFLSKVPFRLDAIARWCDSEKKVALVLNRNGEILIFKNRRLQFTKRRGKWCFYPHRQIVSRLGNGDRALRAAIYDSCLDVSFARTGGCIAWLTAKSESRTGEFIQKNDLIEAEAVAKTRLLKSAVSKEFHRLDRRLRQELLAMDGALILDHSGKVLAAGAIVHVSAGSERGGRRAAAKQLSSLGLAIKISADGPIEGFRDQKEIFVL